MKKNIRFYTLAISLLGFPACAAGTLPDYNVLGSLRVLALQADQPEVDPGASVTLTPVVSDLGAGRALSYSAVGCVDPGVGYGASPTCAASAGTATLASGSIPPVGAVKHTNTGTAPPVPVMVPATILDNRSPIDKFNGVAYLVVYTLVAANTDGTTSQVTSFKRIIASTRTPKNTNPTLTEINAGTQSLSAFLSTLVIPAPSGTTAALTPVLDPGSAETYSVMNGDGTFRNQTEPLTTTWFISDGSSSFYRTGGSDADGWFPPNKPPTTYTGVARGIVFVAVTRDGRGGEAFKQVEF